MEKIKKNKLHVISHTHWDREWYTEFQDFRQRLVFNIDRLLELLQLQPSFKCFHLDGHTAWLLDYLEIRPQNKEIIRKHIQQGRILMGDWFVMPDEFLLSGESIVRNLLLGHNICQEFGGESMIAGDVIDVFGHISQLPQIFKSFGMEAALLHRGLSGENEKSEMLWEGADGSQILIIKVYPHLGYGDFLAFSEVEKSKLPTFLKDYEKRKREFGTTDILFALDGNDHTSARWDLPEAFAEYKDLFEDTEIIHSNFNDYFADLTAVLDVSVLPKHKGELRTPAKVGLYSETITGTGASRVDLKQQNDYTEVLLSRYAEPLHVWSRLASGSCQKAFLDLAWKFLLLNHPHDSIVGCSIDEVHRDMVYNSHQANLLGMNSIRESIQQICSHIDSSIFVDCDKIVTAFNLSNVDKPVSEIAFEIPSEEVYKLEEKGLTPVLTNENGEELAQQFLHVVKRTRTEYLTGIRYIPSPSYTRHPPENMRVHRYHCLVMDEIAPLSYKTYGVKYVPATYRPALDIGSPASNTMSNGLLAVQINSAGRVNITDLETGTEYKNLIHYTNVADGGNGWYHWAPQSDTTISSLSPENWTNVTIELASHGSLQTTYKVTGDFIIPKELDEHKTCRIGQVPLKITNYLTLTAGEKRLDCKTVICNNAKQHMLQVKFPVSKTLTAQDQYFADTAFDCLNRDIKPIDTTGWVEQYRAEAPIKTFVGVKGETENGLAIITKGICEGCVWDDEDRTIVLTLLRSFSQNIEALDSVDSLLQGELTFEYAIVPVNATDSVGTKMFAEVEKYKYPTMYRTMPVKTREALAAAQDAEFKYGIRPRLTPAIKSPTFAQIGDNVVISTIKAAEKSQGAILRIFNPTDDNITATIKPKFDYCFVYETDMRENRIAKLPKCENIEITLRGKQILTLEFDA